MSKVNFNKSALQAYQDTGLLSSLFLVCKWDAFRMEKEERIALGKTPLSKGWSKEQQLSMESILAHIDKGGNLGFRIPKDWIVIDLDPRNYAATADPGETEDSVAEVLGLLDWDDIEFGYNVVQTGGGGYHIYCQLPDQEIYKRVRTKLKNLQGVDFKRHGGYVIAAGSKHPNGRHYEWIEPLSPETAYKFDDATLKPLLRAPVEDSNDASYGALNGMELQSAFLSKVKASWFPDNDSWFPIMCACHFVTAGSAADEFVEWSTSDPDYAKEGEKIRYRWDSLDDRRGDANTVGTLIYQLKQYGEDFGELMDLLGKNDFADLVDEDGGEDESIEAIRKTADSLETKLSKENDGMTSAAEFIASLPDNPDAITNEQVSKAIRMMLNEDDLTAIRLRKVLMEKANLNKAEFNEIAKELKRKQSEDLPVMLRELVLENWFNHGRHLRFVVDTFYRYRGTYWAPTIEQHVAHNAEQLLPVLKEKINIPIGDLSMINQCVELAKVECHREDNTLLSAAPSPIVNCLDYELHIDSRAGTVTREKHSYKSNLYSVLNIKCGDEPFDASTEVMCPLFHRTLREIFDELSDRDDVIRHFGELLGYMIQPNKNIASTWLFKGPGGDGKSTLLKIISALLGNGFCMSNQDILNRKDPHGLENLPGKLVVAVEELSDSTRLNEVAIKELSESRLMEVNPKGRKKFTFAYSGTLVMCANSWPRIGDVTIGMRDRLNVIPFTRRFRSTGTADRNRADSIISNPLEMAGVLRWALQGLNRLRQRGDFKAPVSCLDWRDEWLRESNNVIRYVYECFDKVAHDESKGKIQKPLCTMVELHDHYEQWCANEGFDPRFVLGRHKLHAALLKLGIRVKESQMKEEGYDYKRKNLRVFGLKYREGFAPGDFGGGDFDNFM